MHWFFYALPFCDLIIYWLGHGFWGRLRRQFIIVCLCEDWWYLSVHGFWFSSRRQSDNPFIFKSWNTKEKGFLSIYEKGRVLLCSFNHLRRLRQSHTFYMPLCSSFYWWLINSIINHNLFAWECVGSFDVLTFSPDCTALFDNDWVYRADAILGRTCLLLTLIHKAFNYLQSWSNVSMKSVNDLFGSLNRANSSTKQFNWWFERPQNGVVQ